MFQMLYDVPKGVTVRLNYAQIFRDVRVKGYVAAVKVGADAGTCKMALFTVSDKGQASGELVEVEDNNLVEVLDESK